MAGGINAWKGLKAEGFPEAGIPWFAAARSSEELIALAWVLEDSTCIFYSTIALTAEDSETANLLQELVRAEERHKQMLRQLHRDITGTSEDIDFISILGRYPHEKMMEGGMELDEALCWAEGKEIKAILELAMSLEVSSYDRYLHLQQRVTDERSVNLFRILAAEEKRHLAKLTDVFEKYL